MKATITSLIFLLLSLTVSSQTYKYIGIEEGLSNQKIYKIQKDARGYMWFLTHVGIDQYNGKEIKHYKLKEGNRELDPLLNINVSIRPRACFFPLFSFLPLWLHYNLNPLCVQY